MAMCKEYARIAKVAENEHGWKVVVSGGNHLKWTSPDGPVVFSSATPSDGRRASKNLLRDLKKAGLDLTEAGRRRKAA